MCGDYCIYVKGVLVIRAARIGRYVVDGFMDERKGWNGGPCKRWLMEIELPDFVSLEWGNVSTRE
jgi:hypothetical protein